MSRRPLDPSSFLSLSLSLPSASTRPSDFPADPIPSSLNGALRFRLELIQEPLVAKQVRNRRQKLTRGGRTRSSIETFLAYTLPLRFPSAFFSSLQVQWNGRRQLETLPLVRVWISQILESGREESVEER